MCAQRSCNNPLNLLGRVAVLTGASRGAGRAIAAVLGEHGATVYVSGRSVRGQPTTDDLPGTIDDTAEEVTRRGGTGIAVRCDHANEHAVEVLFKRVREEGGRLDILVNSAWGGYEGARLMLSYFWKAPLRLWDAMFERGLKAHLLAIYFAIPLMIESPAAKVRTKTSKPPGLIVSTVAWDRDRYIGNFYDVAKHSIVRFALGVGRGTARAQCRGGRFGSRIYANRAGDVARRRGDGLEEDTVAEKK
jgi:NAD(P)-dependent dehydrogenase (short-subunit alcohol dehydrogenase family)